ncbi:helix-turn-helix transcriptional regulator [Mesorhizobium sp. B2-6-1]|uniref:helix-turn-helix domain-containing protein n=1 Tax=Mesorhizobium sp. B2-6-1 TaxID=2589916 RepID=UPI001125D22E|nr:helix-turn-helix transcriptional regulator [Mesorhizobium sp. B2-6-1]TPJ57649.1 helix-turn-helix transcriptional regulator [Mesorhizobium sp. B2-6-1]
MSTNHALPQNIVAAVAAGANPVRAMRESLGYSLEDLAVTCGLAIDEIAEIEAGGNTDPSRLRRIAHALGLPDGAIGLGRNEEVADGGEDRHEML